MTELTGGAEDVEEILSVLACSEEMISELTSSLEASEEISLEASEEASLDTSEEISDDMLDDTSDEVSLDTSPLP